MSNNSALSILIKEISERESKNHKKPGLICFDTKSNRLVEKPKKGFLVDLFNTTDLQYYLIGNDSVELSVSNIIVDDFASGLELELEFRGKVSITDDVLNNPGVSIGKLLNLNQDFENLSQTFDHLVRKSIETVADSHETKEYFILNFHRKEIQKNLSISLKNSLKDFGFNAEVKISVKDESFITKNESKNENGHVNVKFQDYDHPLDVEYSYYLSTTDDKRVLILLMRNKLEEIPDLVRAHIRRFLTREKVNEMIVNKEDVEKRFLKVVEKDLSRFGYDISISLLLKKEEVPDNKQIHLEYPISCKILEPNFGEKIEVNNSISFCVGDFSVFMQSGEKDMEEWVKGKLDEICTNHLFHKSYQEVVLNKDLIERKIILEMERASKEKGLEVKHHSILPFLDPILVKENGLKINCTKEFNTRSIDVKVGVQLILDGKITQLEKVKDYIKPDIRLSEIIETKAVAAMEAELHSIEPEKAFLFDSLPKASDAHEETCEVMLENAISRVLEEFPIDNLRLTLKFDASEINERLRSLAQGTRKIDIVITPTNVDARAEKISFDLEYQVVGLDDDKWYFFYKNKKSTLEEEEEGIKGSMVMKLQEALQNKPIEELRYRDDSGYKKLREKVVGPVIENMRNVYGLNIQIISFLRKSSEIEERLLGFTKEESFKELEGKSKEQDLSREERHEELRKRLVELRELEMDNDEGENNVAINRVKKRILEIKNEGSSTSVKAYLDGTSNEGGDITEDIE